MPCASFPLPCHAMPWLCSVSPRLCGSLSGSASRLQRGASRSIAVAACFNEARIISGAGYAFPGRYGVSLFYAGARRAGACRFRCKPFLCPCASELSSAIIFRLSAMRCLCRANSCCAQQSLCFAIIAINASPSLRGEMPYLCVANPATLSLCLQCFSLTARYIAILSLLHVLLYLTHQIHSHAFQGHAFAPLI